MNDRYTRVDVCLRPSEERRITILLADESAESIRNWAWVLESKYEVIRIAGLDRRLLPAVRKRLPQAVVIGISVRQQFGENLVSQLRSQFPHIAILAVITACDSASAERVLTAGADAVLPRQAVRREILSVLERISAEQGVCSKTVIQRVEECRRRIATRRELTARQSEVLDLAAEGFPHREIAERLQVTVKTVEYHKAQIKRKLSKSSGNSQ